MKLRLRYAIIPLLVGMYTPVYSAEIANNTAAEITAAQRSSEPVIPINDECGGCIGAPDSDATCGIQAYTPLKSGTDRVPLPREESLFPKTDKPTIDMLSVYFMCSKKRALWDSTPTGHSRLVVEIFNAASGEYDIQELHLARNNGKWYVGITPVDYVHKRDLIVQKNDIVKKWDITQNPSEAFDLMMRRGQELKTSFEDGEFQAHALGLKGINCLMFCEKILRETIEPDFKIQSVSNAPYFDLYRRRHAELAQEGNLTARENIFYFGWIIPVDNTLKALFPLARIFCRCSCLRPQKGAPLVASTQHDYTLATTDIPSDTVAGLRRRHTATGND